MGAWRLDSITHAPLTLHTRLKMLRPTHSRPCYMRCAALIFISALGCKATPQPSPTPHTSPVVPRTLKLSTSNTPHGVSQAIALNVEVLDATGQPILNPSLRTIAPQGDVLDPRHVRFEKEGRYSVHVEVLDAQRAVLLSDDLTIVVNDHGPTITCEGLDWPIRPAQPVTIRGRVEDALGVTALRVAGKPVSVGPDGRWATTWTSSQGLAALEIHATDGEGLTSNTTCLGMVTPAYPNRLTAAHLHITQDALDDHDRKDTDSVGDLLHAALHSPALRVGAHQWLLELNPLKNSCDQRILGSCVVHTRVEYEDLDIRGPHQVHLSFVEGGLRVRAQLRAMRIKTTLRAGAVRTSGWASLSSLSVDMTLPLTMREGKLMPSSPHIHDIKLGQFSTAYPGAMGTLIEASGWALEGTIRQTMTRGIVEALTTTARTSWTQHLLTTHATRAIVLDIPRLDGKPATRIQRTLTPSTLVIRPAALTASLELSMASSIGAGQRPSPPAPPTTPTHAFTARANLAPVNQLLHELWTRGHFTLPTQRVMGTSWDLNMKAPPFVSAATAGDLLLHVGPIAVTMESPLGSTSFHIGAQLSFNPTPSPHALTLPEPTLVSLFIQWPDTMHTLVMRQSLHALVRSALTQTLAQAWAGKPKQLFWPSLTLPVLLRPTTATHALKPSDVSIHATPHTLNIDFNVLAF